MNASIRIGEWDRLQERAERIATANPAHAGRIYGRPLPQAVGFSAAERQQEQIRRLRRENAELRHLLSIRRRIDARMVDIESVILLFVRLVTEAGFTVDGEPYSIRYLRSGRRCKSISKPRQVCMWLCRTICKEASLPQITRAHGLTDHTTCIHACKRVESAFLWSPPLREIADKVIAAFRPDKVGAEP